MKRFLVFFFIIIIFLIPEFGYCQGIWGAWDKAASSVDHHAIEKGVRDAINLANSRKTTTIIDRREEREETERRNHLRNVSNVLSYIDETEYRSTILDVSEFRERLKSELAYTSSILDYYKDDDGIRKLIQENLTLKQKVKDKIWEQRGRICEFAKNPALKELIDSDPQLRKHYKIALAKQDIRQNSRNILNYIQDPIIKQEIKEDRELVRILAEEIEKKAKEERELQERLEADEKAEQNRRERLNQKEKNRKKEEGIRAKDQETRNKIERTETNIIQNEQLKSPIFAQLPDISSLNISIPDPNALMISKPIDVFEINNTDDYSKKDIGNKGNNQNIQGEYYDEDLEKKSYLEEKVDDGKDWWNANDYPYKINKTYETSKEKLSTVIKETPENARKKVISIPKNNLVDKLKEWGRNTINIAYPGANLEEKAEVVIEVEKNEKGFIFGRLTDILDFVSNINPWDSPAVWNEKLKVFDVKEYNESKEFTDKNRSLANRYIKAWGK